MTLIYYTQYLCSAVIKVESIKEDNNPIKCHYILVKCCQHAWNLWSCKVWQILKYLSKIVITILCNCNVITYLLSLPTENMTTATSPILLKWDPKSLEIRTLTVERLLEPLVTQVIKYNLWFRVVRLLKLNTYWKSLKLIYEIQLVTV